MPQQPSATCDLIVHNGYVISMDEQRSVYPRGAVAISGLNIEAVGEQEDVCQRFEARHEIDARGGAIHPGFVDGHYHTGVHLTCSSVTDDPSKPAVGVPSRAKARVSDDEESLALYSRWFNALTDKDEYVSGLLVATEMLRCGVTCFMEAGTALEPDAIATAAKEVGIRALVADPFLWDLLGTVQSAGEIKRAPATTDRCLSVLGRELRRNKDPEALVQGHVAIYGIGSATDELQTAAKACADEHGVVLAQHLAFTPDDAASEDQRLGKHSVLHLADIGVLGENTTFVHVNVVRDDEVEPLVESGAAVVWHPANYMFYGVNQNIPYRMVEMVERGVPSGFGTDVAKVWSFGEGPFVAYLLARNDGHYLPAARLMEMMTLGGACAVGLAAQIGSLETGKRADLVIRNPDLAEALPGFDPILDAMLVSRSRSIDTVICNGEIVVEHSHLTRLDESDVYAKARKTARTLCDKVGLTPTKV